MNWFVITPLTTLIFGFIGGLFTKAWAAYLSNLWTDRRHKRDDESQLRERYRRVNERCRDFLDDLRQELQSDNLLTEFYASESGMTMMGKCIFYTSEIIPRLMDKLRILEDEGFLIDVTDSSVSRFRITPALRTLLLE